MTSAELQQVIKTFSKREFIIPSQSVDYYMYGFCGEFAVALNSFIREVGDHSEIVSIWGNTDTPGIPPDELVWVHDCVLFDNSIWDITGKKTPDSACEFWKNDFTNLVIRKVSGIIEKGEEIYDKDLEIIEKFAAIYEELFT